MPGRPLLPGARASRLHSVDVVGIVTTFEGEPSPSGAIANRIGDFDDVSETEKDSGTRASDLVETILSSKNRLHNNY